MNLQQKSLRFGTAMILCATMLRLASAGVPAKLVQMLSSPQALSFMLYLETGRVVRPTPETPQTTPPVTTEPPAETTIEATAPVEEETQPAALPVFSQQDADLVEVNSVCGYDTDLPSWLAQPLNWDLTGDGPTVLIVHTHATESYKNTEDYKETSPYRTADPAYNMVSIGEALAQVLEQGGIGVIHDKTLHDAASFSGAYGAARKSIKQYLSDYPSIRMVLDIHRDAVENDAGKQLSFTTNIDGQKAAQLMLVVGTDANGLKHPDWEQNMAWAVKLQAWLQKQHPGICRPISFRKQRFNQDLTAGSLIVEVGAAGNTRQQALEAARLLGNAIIDLSKGATTVS